LLTGRLLAACKFAESKVLKPDALVGAAYIAMSVAHATLSPGSGEVFITVIYMAIAAIHLLAPRFPDDDCR
jgi:hypothetical protein